MRKHLVFIVVIVALVGLCWASGLLKPLELLITSALLITVWLLRTFKPKLKSSASNLLLLVVSVFFPAAIIDIGYHLYLLNKPNGERIESEVETIFKYKPNTIIEGPRYGDLAEMGMLTKEFPETRFLKCQIDELGYRNPIGQKDKKNRILLVGDSFGFGAMTDGENIADYLRNDFGTETYNLSLPGYGPWQEFYTLRQEIDNIKKDDTCTVVWLLFTGNDLAGRYDSVNVATKKTNWRDDFYSFRKHSPIREAMQRVFNPKALADTNVKQTIFLDDSILYYKPYQQQEIQDSVSIKKHKNYVPLLNTIESMALLSKQKNVKLYTIVISAKERHISKQSGASPLSNLISKHLKNNGIDHHIFPYTPGGDAVVNFYLHNDTHLNDYGNQVISRLIIDYLIYSGTLKESQMPTKYNNSRFIRPTEFN